jgi:hypothetical protein
MASLLVTLPVLAACGSSSGGHATATGAAASCVGPYLNDQPPKGPFRASAPTVRPGETLTIYGHWYTDTCNDTGGHDPLLPLSPVQLTVALPDGRTEHLGRFTPSGRDMGFAAAVCIPAATPAGTATIRDDVVPYSTSYRFTIGT